MHESSRCPICSSELYIGRGSSFCSNPSCSYRGSNIFISYKKHMMSNSVESLIPLAFILIALGFILLAITLIFAASTFILFIPFILPIPFLRKLVRRSSLSKQTQRV